jgi:poly(hydroxyalkanoate) depolymerase family esterase
MEKAMDARKADGQKKVEASPPKWFAGTASLARIDSRAWMNMGTAKLRDMARDLWGPWMAEPRVAQARVSSIMSECASGVPKRRARLFIPDSAKPGCPLLVMLHGCLQDADSFARLTRMDDVAKKDGFCVLYPDQDVGAHAFRAWNWNTAEGQKRLGGEPEAIASLIRKAQAMLGVKPRFTGLAGISAGGAMAASMAHLYPELIGAVALVAAPAPFTAKSTEEALAEMKEGPGPQVRAHALAAAMDAASRSDGARRRLPALIVHGMSDPSVDLSHAAALEQAGLMLNAALGKDDSPAMPWTVSEAAQEGGVARLWRDPLGRVVAALATPAKLGHAWSGGDSSEPFSQQGFDQSRLVVDFFKAARTGAWSDFEPEALASRMWAGANRPMAHQPVDHKATVRRRSMR